MKKDNCSWEEISYHPTFLLPGGNPKYFMKFNDSGTGSRKYRW
jgi:hypothetical protein